MQTIKHFNMKKLIIGLAALILLTISSNAQQKREMAGRHMKQQKAAFAKQLNLSEDQKKQAKLFRENYRKQVQELNKNENITVKEARDRKYTLMQDQKAKMQGLLTVEQKAKAEQLKAERKEKMEQHFAMKMDKMKTRLNLSDDQVIKMKAQRESMIAKLKALKEDDKMDRVSKKEKLVELRSHMMEERKKIFTPDQLKQIEEHKKRNPEKKTEQ
jgi:hypothetical protein